MRGGVALGCDRVALVDASTVPDPDYVDHDTFIEDLIDDSEHPETTR